MDTTTLPPSKTRTTLNAVLVGVALYLGTAATVTLSMPPYGMTTFWPVAPVVLAVILLTDRRYWWIYFLVLVLHALFLSPMFLDANYSLSRKMLFLIANIAEVLIAGIALTSSLKHRINFDRLRDLVLFLIWAVLVAPFVTSSIVGAIAFNEPEISYWAVWKTAFLSHSLAQLTLTPVIILWLSNGLGWVKELSFIRWIEASALTFCLFVVGFFAFGSEIGSSGNFPALFYTPLPILLWAVIRFGPRAICTAVLFLMLLIVWNAVQGRGPFTAIPPQESVLSLQLLLIAISCPFLLLGSLFSERKQLVEKEKVRAQAQLDSSEKRLEAVIDSMVDGLITIRASGEIISFNPAAEQIFGYTCDEIIGQNIKTLMPASFADNFDQNLKNYVPTRKRIVIGCGREVLGLRKNGSTFPMELGISKLSIGDDYIFTGTVHDISEHKFNLAELALAREEAEQANRAKSDFLATMSHEIRTPLNGIIGISELLELQNLGADQRRMLQTIRNSSYSLSRIINDILDFSKMEAGKLEVESISFQISNVIEGVAEMLVSAADKENVDLHLFIDPRLPPRIYGDPTRLRQILVNLVGNAIKFSGDPSKRGSVELCVEISSGDRLQFKVIDNGIGIDADAQQKLFQSFSQAEQSTTRRFGGSGLGLVISKNLAELMGGYIELDSAPNEGSTFTLILPLVAAWAISADAAPDVSGLRVLALIKGETLRKNITSYLHAGGALVDFVDNFTAMESLRPLLTTYDVLVVDSEYSILEQQNLVSSLRDSGEVPRQLFLTRNRSEKLGMRDIESCVIASAPIMPSSFIRSISLLGGRIAPEPLSVEELLVVGEVPDIAEAEALGELILLVEDNLTNQEVITQQLNILGYAVEVAADGREGYEKWQSGRYGLVLMDCHMPVMDGFESTKAIRQQESQEGSKRIPIIAVTANALEGEADRCTSGGMDDYLSKPMPLKKLSELLTEWLPRSGKQEAPTETKKGDLLMEPFKQNHVIDPAALNALVGDNPARHRQLLSKYSATTPPVIDEFSAAYQSRDAGKLGGVAHKLKSSSRAVGANRLADTLQRLETSGQEGDWMKIDQDFPEMKVQTEEVLQHILSLYV